MWKITFIHWLHGLIVRSQFIGANYHPSNVGEDIILPRSASPQKAITLGEFVSMSNMIPFNRTLRNRSLAGG